MGQSEREDIEVWLQHEAGSGRKETQGWAHVGAVRTEARGADESTQGDRYREERISGTGTNMPEKHFSEKQEWNQEHGGH